MARPAPPRGHTAKSAYAGVASRRPSSRGRPWPCCLHPGRPRPGSALSRHFRRSNRLDAPPAGAVLVRRLCDFVDAVVGLSCQTDRDGVGRLGEKGPAPR